VYDTDTQQIVDSKDDPTSTGTPPRHGHAHLYSSNHSKLTTS
jgi:hypothetical protein